MEALCQLAVEEALAAGGSYADVRVVDRRLHGMRVKNDTVDVLTDHTSRGLGVRTLARGAWGFAASARLERDEVRRVARESVRIARASATAKGEDVRLGEVQAHRGRYVSPRWTDPWEVPLEERLALLTDAQGELAAGDGIRVRTASLSLFRERTTFGSSEGAFLEQDVLHTGAGVEALAVANGEVQKRSYPTSFGGNFAAAGWEHVEALDLVGHAGATGREALALLEAEGCPSGRSDLILGAGQMALQVHESCGHPTELDRVLGMEASYAGTSFLTPDRLGTFRYGSPQVTLVADATTPGGLGTFAYDDEGVPARRVELVREGLFVGYQSSRETAVRFDTASSGNMRADGWSRIPLIRMTNVSLQPGDWGFEELVADTRRGLYLETNRSWSIDDRRLNFQFGTEVAWTVEDGELRDLVRNPSYTGITYEFWRRCDAVCSDAHGVLWGIPNCGKGEPSQVMRVGHRTPPARFRDVQVGVG